MKLQNKILLVIVPMVVGPIFGLGLWARSLIMSHLHDTMGRYQEGVLETYISQSLEKHYMLLHDNNLDDVPSFVEQYQQVAAESARDIEFLWPGKVIIIGPDLSVIMNTSDQDSQPMEDIWIEVADSILNTTHSIEQGHLDLEEGPVHFRAEEFPPWQWCVILINDGKAVRSSSERLTMVTAIAGVASAVVLIGIVQLMLSTVVLRPILRLKEVAARIAAKERGVRADIASTDEMGDLSTSIDAMARQIENDRDELQRWSTSLELRVQRRTEQLQAANDMLRESEERFRAIMDSTPDSILVLNKEYVYLYANAAAMAYLRMVKEQIIGRSTDEVLAGFPTFKEVWEKRIDEVLASGQTIRVEDNNLMREGVYSESSLSPLLDEKAKPYAVAIVYRDVTERKKMDQLRKDTERIIRHELRTPLVSVLSLVGILEDEENITREQNKMLSLARGQAKRMLGFIDMNQDLAKMEAGGYQPRLEDVDLAPMLRFVVKELAPLIADRQVRVAMAVNGHEIAGASSCIVRGEEILLYSMLLNLLKNAVEASSQGGKVEVELADQGERTLVVRNDQPVPEVLRESFGQKYATHGKDRGTGLGVYTARLVAETLGGSFSWSSSQGEGTEIVISLPKEESEALV